MYSLARLYSIFNCRFQDRPHLIAPPGGTESDDKLLLTGLLILLDTFFSLLVLVPRCIIFHFSHHKYVHKYFKSFSRLNVCYLGDKCSK